MTERVLTAKEYRQLLFTAVASTFSSFYFLIQALPMDLITALCTRHLLDVPWPPGASQDMTTGKFESQKAK